MSNIRTGGIGQSKWVRPACLFVVLIAANVFTYWFLCRPELEMKKMDAKGYSYLQTVLGRAGGIWSLSAPQRCAVHCLFATLLVLVIFAVLTALTKYRHKAQA
jgi:hypothetical protein